MKKFLFKAFIFLLPITILILSFLLLPTPTPVSLVSNKIKDGHKLLLETSAPRIVLVGGSNLSIHIDTERIESEFNMPVINMGISAGLGLGRAMYDILPYMQKDDILIIAGEYRQFTHWWNGTDLAVGIAFDMHQYSWSLPHQPYLQGQAKSVFVSYLKYKLTETKKNLHNPISNTDTENEPIKPVGFIGNLNPDYLTRFILLTNAFFERGVRVLVTYPTYEEISFHNSESTIYELDAALRKIPHIEVISVPETYCFSGEYMRDVIHANDVGRELRTKLLIEDLKIIL
jgi:hypothetical protein